MTQTKTKKKTIVLLMSTHFMKDHPRAGDPTGFEDKILSGEKIHTIRGNYPYWKKRVDQINRGDAVLSVRKWSGKPYRSKQVEICQFEEVGIQKIRIEELPYVDGGYQPTVIIAHRDGLEVRDFTAWFADKVPFEGALIHFTDFKY